MMSRRTFLAASSAVAGAPAVIAGPRPTDIRIEQVEFSYEDYLYRTPIKFGGVALDRVTLLNVTCLVRHGRRACGAGLRLDAAGQRLVVPVARSELRRARSAP